MRVRREAEKLLVECPYLPELPALAAELMGWRVGLEEWEFSPVREAEVRQLLVQLYGTDGDDSPETVEVLCLVGPEHRWQSEVYAYGRLVCRRSRYDGPVVLGEGVRILQGSFPDDAGSREMPALGCCGTDDVELLVADVPKALAKRVMRERNQARGDAVRRDLLHLEREERSAQLLYRGDPDKLDAVLSEVRYVRKMHGFRQLGDLHQGPSRPDPVPADAQPTEESSAPLTLAQLAGGAAGAAGDTLSALCRALVPELADLPFDGDTAQAREHLVECAEYTRKVVDSVRSALDGKHDCPAEADDEPTPPLGIPKARA